jgi:hypothetical protein
LTQGCTPRVARAAKVAVTAQHEVAERKVSRSPQEFEPVEQATE